MNDQLNYDCKVCSKLIKQGKFKKDNSIMQFVLEIQGGKFIANATLAGCVGLFS